MSVHHCGGRAASVLAILLTLSNQLAPPAHAQTVVPGKRIALTSILNEIKPKGGYLGILSHDGTPSPTEVPDVTVACQVLDWIDPDSPLNDAGIRVGDSICSIDNAYFQDREGFNRFINTRKPGSAQDLIYYRPIPGSPGQFTIGTASVDVIAYKELSVPARIVSDESARRLPDNHGRAGLSYGGHFTAIHYGSDPTSYRVYAIDIGGISDNSPASSSPLAVNDSIYSVNDSFFLSQDGFSRYIESLEPGSIARIEFYRPSDQTNYRISMVIGSTDPAYVASSSPPPEPVEEKQADDTPFFQTGLGKALAVIGTVAVAVIVGKAITESGGGATSGGSGSSESSGGSGGGNPGSSSDFTPSAGGGSSSSEARPSTPAAPVKPIDPFYGACHGGAFNGCN